MLTAMEEEQTATWGDQVEAAEQRGELGDEPPSTLTCDEPDGSDTRPYIVDDTPPSDVLTLPESTDPDLSVWEELAAAEAFMGEPEATLSPSFHPLQAQLLEFVRPYWLQGEAGISQTVCASIHDHGMDYSAAALDRLAAWLLLQRRDIAAHLRAWLARHTGPGHNPSQVLGELQLHVMSLEEARALVMMPFSLGLLS